MKLFLREMVGKERNIKMHAKLALTVTLGLYYSHESINKLNTLSNILQIYLSIKNIY